MRSIVARNHVLISGKGSKTLLFAHGLGSDHRIWRRVAPAFEAEHRVITFDYVGVGESDRSAYSSARYATLSGYAADILEICDELELRDVSFIGHSVSCMTGALAAIAAPERFAELVMIAPSPRYLNDPPAYVGGFEREDIERLLELMDQNFIGWASALSNVATAQPELARELRDNLCALDRLHAREFARATFSCDHRADLAGVTPPTLVIQCTDDDISPVSVGAYVASHLPHGELRMLDTSGHLPHMTNADETVALIREFLRRGPLDAVA